MRKLVVPAKRINSEQLRAELIAAGVPLRAAPVPGFPWMDIIREADTLTMVIDSDSDQYDAIATQVIQAHIPPAELTASQLKRRAARAALRDADDRTLIAVRSGLRVIYQNLTEARTAINQLRSQLVAAGLPLTVQPLINRTWDQALAAVEQQIDAEVP